MHLNSPISIGQKIISEEDQPGDSDAFSHELSSSSIATGARAFQREDSRRQLQKKKLSEVEKIAKFKMVTGKQTLTEKFSRRTFGMYRSIVNFYR